ncbi:hypothetical protein [Streptomyces sp. WAC06614]|uniref:hypothetical protein n=1 Tax=Streptomyces sp. WAC06614 TaxID=2487416 RepID=UPI0021AE42DD|nr:hypothetical protein [Streptomyces sp. WAC06614]
MSAGRRRRAAGPVPGPARGPVPEESVRQGDPPIYRDLVDRWTVEGRTVPGRRDPEWSRLMSSPVWPHGPLFAERPPR